MHCTVVLQALFTWPLTAEDEALIHVVRVNDALQQPLLEYLDRLAHALRAAHLRPKGIMHMHVVCVGLHRTIVGGWVGGLVGGWVGGDACK